MDLLKKKILVRTHFFKVQLMIKVRVCGCIFIDIHFTGLDTHSLLDASAVRPLSKINSTDAMSSKKH